jgi:hypothetical protein
LACDRERRVEKALTLTRELHGQRSAAGESELEKE